ncbi:MAG: hypothetical protein JWQ12_1408 [Glaciihabitans sp.]|nr:hypothetical protein [Glaciihabitans sp.]
MSDRSRAPAESRSRWFPLVWVIPGLLVLFVLIVIVGRLVAGLAPVQSFMLRYPGQLPLPADAPVGFPAWLNVQHFLNSFLLLFIVRTGWQLRTGGRPSAFWMRRNDGLLRTRNSPVRIGMPLWFHLSLDALWVLNGLVYYVLLFSTGQWMRLVPLDWAVVPNALSTAIQYATLYWPTDDGWNNYNALQVLSYFATVFVAAPLALITGLRMTPGLAGRLAFLDRAFPIRLARAIHWPVMLWFVLFTAVHLTLVLATGAVRNLNHMYAGRDDGSLWGALVFVVSIVVLAIAWVVLRPPVLVRIAQLSGTVRRLP